MSCCTALISQLLLWETSKKQACKQPIYRPALSERHWLQARLYCGIGEASKRASKVAVLSTCRHLSEDLSVGCKMYVATAFVCVIVLADIFQHCMHCTCIGPNHIYRAPKIVQRIGNESVPIQLARCRFPGLAICNAKILMYFSNKIHGSNFIKQHSQTVMV